MARRPFEKLAQWLDPSGFSRFELYEIIAEGSMSEIRRAYDRKSFKDVALKVLRQDGLRMRALLRAKQPDLDGVITVIDHPNVVHTYEFGRRGAKRFQVMEHVRGSNLSRMKGRPMEELVRLLLATARGLQHLHNTYNLVHRDMNPNNVIVTPNYVPKIIDMDFSFCDIGDSSGFLRRSGTLGYMAPEQVKGRQLGKSVDIYSWGAMAYEMVTGTNPYRDRTADSDDMRHENTLSNHLRMIPSPPSHLNPTVPAWFDRVVMRCLQIDPMDRFASFDQLFESLEDADDLGVEVPGGDGSS